MVDVKIVELINREIDGELNTEEKSRLDIYLKNSEEASALYEDLKVLADNLNDQEQAEPPGDLKSTILSKINPELYRPDSKREPTILKTGIVFDRQRVRTILAYAAVLIVGFCLSALLLNPSITSNNKNLYKILGTIGIQEISNVRQVKSIPVNIDRLNGEVILKQAESYVWLEFNLVSGSEFTTRLAYDSRILEFLLFRPINPKEIMLKHANNSLNIITTQPFVLSFIRNSNQASQLEFSIQAGQNKSTDFKFLIPNIQSP